MTGGPVGFWQATPRILAAAVKGAMARAKNTHRLAAWTAWHAAALGRIEKMPSLDSIIGGDRAERPKQQTWQDQFAAAQQWAAAAG